MTEPDKPLTDSALASLLAVARRRIYKWRNDPLGGAPAGTDLVAWRDWLASRGKMRKAVRLSDHLAAVGTTPTPASVPAPVAAPPSAIPDDLAKRELYWKAVEREEKAIVAQRERRRLDMELVEISDVNRLMIVIGGSVVAAIGSTVWQRLRPCLDGLAAERPDLVRRLKAEHDAAILQLRTDLPRTLAADLRAAFPKT